jgi:hypothetical protein
MRFLLMHRLAESRPEAFHPSPEFIARMGGFIEEVAKAGVLITAEGVLPTAKGALVRRTDGKRTVTDGPFTDPLSAGCRCAPGSTAPAAATRTARAGSPVP